MTNLDLAEPPGRRIVFLSYAHDDDAHKSNVLVLATELRLCGIDVKFDLWHENDRQDWYAWMLHWIRTADFVIVVASPRYREVGDGTAPADRNRGVQAEAAQIRELLYRNRAERTLKLLPVILPGRSRDELPDFVQPYTASHFTLESITKDGMERLLRAITAQPRHVPPALGEIPTLPPATSPTLSEHLGEIREALAKTVTRHGRRTRSNRPMIMAEHPGAADLVERLSSPEGPQVQVVHGRAGAGKSNVVMEALDTLIADGWTAAVVRMDAVRQVSSSAVELGSIMELPNSPVATISDAAGDGPRVLVVDQLDAVSTYSGRIPDSYDAIMEVLEQAEDHPALKIVLVVRTVDLESDPRMRSLLADDARVECLAIGKLDTEAVQSALKRAGVNPGELTPITMELLRVPLHLAVFSRLVPASQRLQYRTLPDLYEQFTKQVQQSVERESGLSDMHKIVSALVTYMSDHESLQAPVAVLADVPPSQVAAFVSAGLLIEDTTGVSFFHETYFDFHFARTFVAQGRDLHEFLFQSGQHLFRRAQTRQVLEYLAGFDRQDFHAVVARLLTSGSLRSHLLDVAVGVLQQLDATADDWLALERIAFGQQRRSAKITHLLSKPVWFDAADQAERWEMMIADSTSAAANQLIYAARERPERVAELVRPYIDASPEWNRRLRAMIQWSLRPGLVSLAIELLAKGVLDDIRGPIAVNSDFWSVLYPIKDSDPVGAARIVGAHLRRAITQARATGESDPFTTGHLADHSSSGASAVIAEIAAAAPEQFLVEVLQFVAEVTAAAGNADDSGLVTIPRWSIRIPGSNRSVDDELFVGLESALCATASTLFDTNHDLISSLANSELEPMRFLACRTYTAAAEQAGDEAIDWLLSDHRNLDLGWLSSPRWASRELIEAAAKWCDDDRLDDLCDRLLDYYPDRETTTSGRVVRGRAQYELLSAVPADRRPADCARRIDELARKFPGAPPEPPSPIQVSWVGPPIPESAGAHMTDEDWRRAILKYDNDRREQFSDFTKGGAQELAFMLGRHAQANPERFARLALTLGAGTPAEHFNQLIREVAGRVPVELLARLCGYAHQIAGSSVGQEVCRAVGNVAAEVTEGLVDLLVHYADDPDPDREFARTPAHNGQVYFGGDLRTAGINCTRGAAAEAIGHVLLATPEYSDRLLPSVANLVRDPVMAVRVRAAIPIAALLNTHVDVALDLADHLLLNSAVDIFTTRPVVQLLIYAILRAPQRFAAHLTRAVGGSEAAAELAGHAWVVALLNDCLDESVVRDLNHLPAAARRGVAEMLASAPDRRPDLLTLLFNDEDQTVADKAAGVIYRLGDVGRPTAHTLVSAFTASSNTLRHFGTLFRSLEESIHLLPDAVLKACDRVIEIAGADLGDIRTSAVGVSMDMVPVVLRLYRQGNADIRTRCLDIIDAMSDIGAFGLDDALAGER
jgi:hypothetical protein